MKNFVDIRRLRYFRAIVEEGSLSAAARLLNVAQPALSRHVNELESQIGVPLVQRRRDGVTPTDAGRLLLRHAIEILARVEHAEADLSRLGGGQSAERRIRLAIISSLAADLTPILVSTMAREMPEAVLRITEARTLDGRDLLERGEADFAISLSPGGDDEIPFAEEQLYFVSTGEASASAVPVAFAEVAAHRLIMPALGSPLRSFVESAALQAGLSLNVALEIDGAEPRRNATRAGFGSTIFGAHSVHHAGRHAGITARPIVEPTLFRPIFFGARRGLDAAFVGRLRGILAQALVGFGGMEVHKPALPPCPGA